MISEVGVQRLIFSRCYQLWIENKCVVPAKYRPDIIEWHGGCCEQGEFPVVTLYKRATLTEFDVILHYSLRGMVRKHLSDEGRSLRLRQASEARYSDWPLRSLRFSRLEARHWLCCR